MSRHKFVKNLDLDEVLDDYDGAEEEDEGDEELSAQDREQLRSGLAQVRGIIGHEVDVTDREIEESLYYYYYDVPKTVDYILSQKTKAAPTKKKKTPVATPAGAWGYGLSFSLLSPLEPFQTPTPARDFFEDIPWLRVPRHRLAQILVEPARPPGRLLGGSPSTEGSQPKSKLAALAAARKQQSRASDADKKASSTSAALLDNLSATPPTSAATVRPEKNDLFTALRSPPSIKSRQYPVRRRQPSESTSKTPAQAPSSTLEDAAPTVVPEQSTKVFSATPSVFATTIFGANAATSNAAALSELPDRLAFDIMGFAANDTVFSEPSPDDVVLKAQTSAKGGAPAKIATPAPRNGQVDRVVQGVQDVKLAAELPKVKSRNFDVVAEYKKAKRKNATSFVVIGHVDAGKSTIMGRLLHDVKAVDRRTIDKYQKEADRIGKGSFALAWVMDQGTEERERGVTIDFANRQFETETTSFTILDAPGHRDFIPNMIAGASQADFALLVVDASTGNFESGLKGQTKEHALLVRSMGVVQIIVAVNKLDSVDWSKDRFDEVMQQTIAFLTAAGFAAKSISFIPCSGLTGENIVNQASKKVSAWYTGPPLLGALESAALVTSNNTPVPKAITHQLRLTIDDIFRGGVQNPLSISGRIDTGNIQIGDSIMILPSGQIATIKGLDVNDKSGVPGNEDADKPAEWAVAGQHVILHLSDVDANYLKPGDVICPPSSPIHCVKTFKVKLLAFEHIMPMHCEIHRGRLRTPGRISRLEAILDKSTGAVLEGLGKEGEGKRKRPKLIKPGTVARVVVDVEGDESTGASKDGSASNGVPLESGNRVILRSNGETLGAGLVE